MHIGSVAIKKIMSSLWEMKLPETHKIVQYKVTITKQKLLKIQLLETKL